MPTENRSSNNESVRLPRDLVDLALAHLPNDSAAKWEIYELLGQPAQQGQGEPVAITNDMHRLMEAYRLGEFAAEGGSDTIEALAVASFDTVADHGHDADSYMAGFCASLYWQAAPFIGMAIKPSTHADPAEVERLRIELDLRTQEREKFLGWCRDARAESTKLRAQLAELVSAVRSINFGPAHAIQMRGDDEPCYPQRKEWIEWLLELCEATSVEPSASAGSDPWLPLTAPGQIQVGDWLSFTVAGSFICAKARLIIAPGTANEEIVYNLKKNHYFCTDMAIDGTSNHKGVLVAKAKP
ncbi:hypothetical protein [Pseudomonas juntendi]|uniref:hypothetical protein n=1 Tax=Pseudomonas juntendi TaxID=2666183 RepID=UPI0015FBB9AE|nr:hypothetical protein [Pseudomonas juntendi]MBA6133252.1 hypothetical protein [Pseudomonas juntendi]